MYPNLNTYKFKTMSEFMVPMQTLIQTVQYIEGCPSYDLDIMKQSNSGEQVKINDELYTIPYPFIEPVNPEYYQAGVLINNMNNNELSLWKKQIDTRVYPIVHFSVTKQFIEHFDSDPNNACFISAITGYIVSFNYQSISDVKIVNIPNNVASLMSNFLKLSQVSPEAVEISGVPKTEMAKTFFVDSYSRFYSVTPTGADKSVLLTDRQHYFEATSNSKCVLTTQQANAINSLALKAFHNRERIIFTV